MGAVNEIYSLEQQVGVAISQSPSSGTVVTKGAMVDIVVSKGMPPAGAPLLPNFIGLKVEEVELWARDVKGRVKVEEDPKAVGSAGTVVRQDPIEGQPLVEGETINVTIVALVTSDQGYRFSYDVPADRGNVVIRMVARGNKGETEIYKGPHKGGDKIELPISVNSTTRVRIYIDDLLQEEKVIEP